MIYNLAFSPKVKHIDLTSCTKSASPETAEALFKLLKISGSIETLLLGDTDIAKKLSQQFYVSLGECKTLNTLVLDLPAS